LKPNPSCAKLGKQTCSTKGVKIFLKEEREWLQSRYLSLEGHIQMQTSLEQLGMHAPCLCASENTGVERGRKKRKRYGQCCISILFLLGLYQQRTTIWSFCAFQQAHLILFSAEYIRVIKMIIRREGSQDIFNWFVCKDKGNLCVVFRVARNLANNLVARVYHFPQRWAWCDHRTVVYHGSRNCRGLHKIPTSVKQASC
jgi:hypothetical protein